MAAVMEARLNQDGTCCAVTSPLGVAVYSTADGSVLYRCAVRAWIRAPDPSKVQDSIAHRSTHLTPPRQ